MNPYLRLNTKRLTEAIQMLSDMSKGIEYTQDSSGCPFLDASNDLCEVKKALANMFVNYYALCLMECEADAELRTKILEYKRKATLNA